jgi:Fur family iron response transcriptional regulator
MYHLDSGKLTDIDASDVRVTGLPELPPGVVTEGMDIIIRVRPA